MRVLVTGSRFFLNESIVYDALDDVFFLKAFEKVPQESFIVVHGKCPQGGADLLAEKWVELTRKTCPWVDQEPHLPDFARYGSPEAFHVRNREMVQTYPDLCLAFYQNGAKNRGTASTVRLCTDYDIPVRPFWSFRGQRIIDVELP